jgi:hypothetical protein
VTKFSPLVGGDDDTLAAGLADAVSLVLGLGRAVLALIIGRSAAGAVAVQADAVTGAGDAEAFACAAAGGAGHRRGAGAGGAAGAGERWDIRLSIGVRLVLRLAKVNGVEASGELVEAGGFAGRDDVLGLAGLEWLGADNASWGDWAALGDGASGLAGRAAGLDGDTGSWDIEDVELAASGGLDGVLASGIVRNVIAVEDIVVPVALALLDQGALEAKGALEAAGLGGVLGQGKLACIVVPRADEVDGLAVGGSAERKVQLNSGHYEDV